MQNHFLVLLRERYFPILLLAIAVGVAYGHTLDVPFYLDDFSSIEENPIIYHWQGFIELWRYANVRIVGYLTFALNYQIHQFQVPGYHLVNIFIHFLAGWAVWGLLQGLMRTPVLAPILSDTIKRWLPLVIALIFVLHPLQIQAVTYIVQRVASLAAFCYLASLACFLRARLQPTFGKSAIFWTVACLLFALMGFFTKQNTFTLPLSLLLIELIFFPQNQRSRLIVGSITVVGLMMAWVIVAWVFGQNPLSLQAMLALTKETTTISRTAYLATQTHVLWTYISLFLWPASSHIDYNYPIVEGFLYTHANYHFIAKILHSETLWLALGHFLLITVALFNIRRLPLVTFGILFYYLAHMVESSFIPIRDVIFEHRTYLPNLGLCVLLGWLLVEQLPRWLEKIGIAPPETKKFVSIFIIALLVTLTVATWYRNNMWRDPIALWEHNTRQSPDKQRGWVILGKHYIQANEPAKAIDALNRAIERKSNTEGTSLVTAETALNLVVALKMQKRYDEALKWVNDALNNPQLPPSDRAKFLVNQGNIFYEQKRYSEAETAYRQALTFDPHSLNAHNNLANILARMGHFEEAMALFKKVLTIDSSNTAAKENLQKLQELMSETPIN
ncbi:MAG: hypothetical protein BWK79_07555 [Beggiatoa sp. IS2]|nr:MAG: hypothetical protein BWK79_07555 [Beggiatoa sp. IS2]